MILFLRLQSSTSFNQFCICLMFTKLAFLWLRLCFKYVTWMSQEITNSIKYWCLFKDNTVFHFCSFRAIIQYLKSLHHISEIVQFKRCHFESSMQCNGFSILMKGLNRNHCNALHWIPYAAWNLFKVITCFCILG